MDATLSDNRYVFKVNLIAARRASRTLYLRGNRTLLELHKTICRAFGREENRVYSFYFSAAEKGYKFDPYPQEYVSEIIVGQPDPFSHNRPASAAGTTLDSLHLIVGQTFEYLFDFGESSLHEIKVVATQSVRAGDRFRAVAEGHAQSP